MEALELVLTLLGLVAAMSCDGRSWNWESSDWCSHECQVRSWADVRHAYLVLSVAIGGRSGWLFVVALGGFP